jgi:hypothetical protein
MRTICCLSDAELTYKLDNRRQERVDLLAMKCMNNRCEWQGPLNELLDDHARNCSHASIRCRECAEEVTKRELERHQRAECRYRMVRCPRCNEEGKHAEIVGLDAPFTKKHRCLKVLTTCPNRCRGSRKIERGQLAQHLQVCPLQSVDCDFKIVGCEAQLIRKSLAAHTKNGQQEHLQLLLSSVHTKMSLLHREIDFLMQTVRDPTTLTSLACMNSQVKVGRLCLDGIGDQVTFRVNNFEHLSLFSKDDGKWESPPFYFASRYRMELVAHPGGDGEFMGQGLSVSLSVRKPETQGSGNVNQDIGWPMDCAYMAIQTSILPQVNHHGRSHAQPDATLLETKPRSFTAHVCYLCRQRLGYQTIPADKDHTSTEVAREEDFVGRESLVEAGLLFQDSVVLRVELTQCDCT